MNPRKTKSKITLVAILGIATLAFGIYTYSYDRRPIIDLYPVNNNGVLPDLTFYGGNEGELMLVAKNVGKEKAYLEVTVTAEGAQIRSETSQFENPASYGYTFVYDPEPPLVEMPFYIKPNPNVDKITLKVDYQAEGFLADLRYRFDKTLLVFEKSTEPYLPNTFHYNRTASTVISR